VRTYAIGDIHGHIGQLRAILEAIRPEHEDVVITLGDYVNRGPDSSGVIAKLLQLSARTRLVALRGNHEQMLLQARDDSAQIAEFLRNGGDATLRSYSPLEDEGQLADVPDEHWEFTEDTCVDWYETATHFFVHANAYPDLPLAEQPEYMLRWEQFNDPPPHESGKIMVCGHTSQKSGQPRNIGHAICIDTAVHKTGILTCLETGSGKVFQANPAGNVQVSWIDEYLVES
jgi:serine/threonine protein phosphatase 1